MSFLCGVGVGCVVSLSSALHSLRKKAACGPSAEALLARWVPEQ